MIFVNTTNRIIEVFWINYRSQLFRYKTMHPRSKPFKVNTYITHPWIFRDLQTGQLMHVNHQEVYWPKSLHQQRDIAFIHFPLQKLKTIALWRIIQNVKNEEQINQLDALIPNILIRDLKALYSQYIMHAQSL